MCVCVYIYRKNFKYSKKLHNYIQHAFFYGKINGVPCFFRRRSARRI